MKYELLIDIEAVESDDTCRRPVNDVLIFSSDDKTEVDNFILRLQGLFPCVDVEGIKNKRNNRTIYTVFAYKIDEEENPDFYEELDLARFSNLKKAKRFMSEVAKALKEGE